MGNFFYRLRCSAERFMYGRNGSDQLNIALLVLYVVLVLLRAVVVALFPYQIIYLLCSVCTTFVAVLILFRMFSKNLDKRRGENAAFLNWWLPRQRSASARRSRSRDKDHRYFKCPGCGAWCRVPRGKGRIEITCPRCHGTISGKS